MGIFYKEVDAQTGEQARRAWHKPQLIRLAIVFDTVDQPGSGIDSVTHGDFGK